MPKATDFDPRGKTIPRLSKRTLDQSVWDAALERMEHVYDLFDHVAVAFSGGKDSTAILHVALEVATSLHKLPLRVIFWDEEAIPYETEDYVRRVAQRDDVALEWLSLPVQHRNACSDEQPFWNCWAPEDEALWCRPLPPESITELDGFPTEPSKRYTIPAMNGLMFRPEQGRSALVMGIRAAESLIRWQAVSRRTHENYIIAMDRATVPTLRSPVSKVYPCYDWQTEDVWTAPSKFGWDYNRAYDLMEMEGIPHASQRCAPPFGEEPMQKLWLFKTCFPDLWEKLCERVPGAATAARYANSELYSYGEVPPKPADLTWKQYLHDLIARFEDDDARSKALHTVDRYLKEHFVKTADPILPFARHPESGVSWRELSKIAARGNFKERRQLNPGRGNEAAMQAAYDAERSLIEQELGRTIAGYETGDLT